MCYTMHMVENIFLQISILLGITVGIAAIVRFLRQPLLIAYILAGLIAGPLLLNFIDQDARVYEVFSEFGIVLLLFIVGLSLNFTHIKKIGKIAVVVGVSQVVLTTTVGFLILRFFQFSPLISFSLAVASAFSSTIIITKLLSDKKDLETVYGRYAVGLMLVQDVIAITLLFAMNAFIQNSGLPFLQLVSGFIFRGGVVIACIYFLTKFILPRLVERAATSSEFLFLFTIAWCFGVASIARATGLSLEMGAIIAGISLGSSLYQPEISSKIRPLRDFFLILFFILLGSKMTVANFGSAIAPSIALTGFILLGNPGIVYMLFRVMKFTRRNSFLVGVSVGQVSEFGFVLLFALAQANLVPDVVVSMFTMTALGTIFFSSYAITYNETLYRFFIPLFNFFGKDAYQQPEEFRPVYEAWVIGYHRMGWKICETLKELKISFAVIDFNPEVVKQLRQEGTPAYFGDAADVEFLSTFPFAKAKLIISTIPEVDDQLTFVQYVRSMSRKPYLIANVTSVEHLNDFYRKGVDYILMPHMLGGYRMSEILRLRRLSRKTFEKLRREQKREVILRFQAGAHD